ncbi:IST1 homolog [Geodia barretti]|uniref:IST1 homolog n=1 Tax=Geodia barretti TaxID=519541 RepID=A0AA35TWZ0_GEOBA|nr:IST1 homolog [Geodia barretti]
MPSFRAEKLRVNLRLSINRLKLLEKKKTETAMKARREIADYMKSGRIERARIRVEHIVREDYLVEAMEVIELYCDLLLARFGMLEQMSYCEESIAEAVATLIWVAPRLSADVQELLEVSRQFEHKFGKPFVQQARSNLSGTVNVKVIHRLGAEAPKKSLVENYMVEIARNYHIDYQPDPTMFMDDEDTLPPDTEGVLLADEPQALPMKTDLPPTAFQPPPPSTYHQGPPPPMDPGPPPSYRGPPAHQNPHLPPPTNQHLPYPTGPQGGVQPPPLPGAMGGVPPPALDLPPVPHTTLPGSNSGGSGGGGGDVDFDDLTRRFEELKRRK